MLAAHLHLLRALDFRLHIEICLHKLFVEFQRHKRHRVMSQSLDLSLQLAEAVNSGVGASRQHAELVERRIGHLGTVAEALAEAERVEVLVPAEHLLEQVGVPKALPSPLELVDTAAGHLRTRRKEHDIAGINPGQLDSLEAVVRALQEALRVEHAEHVEQGALDLGVPTWIL